MYTRTHTPSRHGPLVGGNAHKQSVLNIQVCYGVSKCRAMQCGASKHQDGGEALGARTQGGRERGRGGNTYESLTAGVIWCHIVGTCLLGDKYEAIHQSLYSFQRR